MVLYISSIREKDKEKKRKKKKEKKGISERAASPRYPAAVPLPSSGDLRGSLPDTKKYYLWRGVDACDSIHN